MKRCSLFAGLVISWMLLSCSQNSLSERDLRRDQIRNNADLKRKELNQVAGVYFGHIQLTQDYQQPATITLEVKDIPQPIDGEVDPVLIPTLTGYLRFLYGSSLEDTEFISFPVSQAEYDPTRKYLDTVFENTTYGKVIAGFQLTDSLLEGSWTAPSVSAAGKAKLMKDQRPSDEDLAPLEGEYAGFMKLGDSDFYHKASLTVKTVFEADKGFIVSTSLRVFYPSSPAQYMTFGFSSSSFNPTTRELSLKGNDTGLSLVASVGKDSMNGKWLSDLSGNMGPLAMKRGGLSLPKEGEEEPLLRGSYKGKLINHHPQTQLDGPFELNFSVGQDLGQPKGIRITGEVLIYIQEVGSYERIPFSEATYNFFTGEITIRTKQKYQLTLRGFLDGSRIEGDFYWDTIGKVAIFEVER